ncbi:TonB-dependent receptor [Faecalibacter bovis]|uniref:TonB-dependent receptor n=1 Tax=Faecalibacter bovis TaxID=2898187 RepID=A0ABX7XAS4_9FLAO|nr:TonB-dependent receptor [Faecalibacter bovis]QTV05001.1 TonB-dependent receptor [Faecalibacter bovis]
MKKFFIPILFICSNSLSFAQENDSILLHETVIQTFHRKTLILESTSSINSLSKLQMKLNHPERLLESFNTLPGVKMEERSPGSYRISLRGSTIRSPFGVRNVKIYLDDFILTDATGNAYLNLIDPQFLSSIDVMKGPQGGEFGSETGGVAVLKTLRNNGIKASVGTGSYNQFHENINYSKQIGKHRLHFGQTHYQSDSYREQSAINRNSFLLKDQWNYNNENELNFILLYTDLDYQTPGGLTYNQMQENRRQARLATPTLPSAVEQQAGIQNKTFLGGINHLWKINPNWKNFVMIQSSYTDFENPFISNYEERQENNFQGRLYFEYEKQLSQIKLNTRFGTELGLNKTKFRNYDNSKGIKGNPQKFDDLQTFNGYYYINQHANFANKWFVDASISLNTMKYNWETLYPNVESGNKSFQIQLLPQIGVSYNFINNWSVRGKIAKGISAPTTEEVRSSTQEIQQYLNAEYGWNKEFGIRYTFNQWFVDLTAFDFHLKDAIVRRQDENGNDFYINSGGTKQRGIEFQLQSKPFNFDHSIFTKGSFFVSGHLFDFKYDHYKIANNDYSENTIPGISKFSLQNSISIELLNKIQVIWSNYYNSKLYLNDANTVEEKETVIGNILVDTNFKIKESSLSIYFGINNLYNTKYSAGYDLNAFGNRFYNPAATTNFYLGSRFTL